MSVPAGLRISTYNEKTPGMLPKGLMAPLFKNVTRGAAYRRVAAYASLAESLPRACACAEHWASRRTGVSGAPSIGQTAAPCA